MIGLNIYEHELASYLGEIDRVETDVYAVAHVVRKGANLTHYSLGLSNRANMIVVGLCGLVEALLTEIALALEPDNRFKLDDIRGTGRSQLKTYLTRTGTIDFGALRYWDKFSDIYVVRNVIVHGHGGLVPPKSISTLKGALERLDIVDVLVGGCRVRMNSSALYSVHSVIAQLVEELVEVVAI